MAKIKVGIFMELVKNPELKVPLIKRKKKSRSHTQIYTHVCVCPLVHLEGSGKPNQNNNLNQISSSHIFCVNKYYFLNTGNIIQLLVGGNTYTHIETHTVLYKSSI